MVDAVAAQDDGASGKAECCSFRVDAVAVAAHAGSALGKAVRCCSRVVSVADHASDTLGNSRSKAESLIVCLILGSANQPDGTGVGPAGHPSRARLGPPP